MTDQTKTDMPCSPACTCTNCKCGKDCRCAKKA